MHFHTRLKPALSLIDLTPLVDVIFLLLIFFIVTSDILPLKSLNIENPSLDRAASPLTTQILVVMDAQHALYVGSKKALVDFSTLKSALLTEINKIQQKHPNVKPTVVISVDKHVPYDVFLRLFSLVQETTGRIRLVYQVEGI